MPEPKEWDVLLVDKDQLGKKKILSKSQINVAHYVKQLGERENTLNLKMKSVSKKISNATLDVAISVNLLREGKAT